MSTLKVNAIQNTSGVEKYLASAWVNFDGTGTVAIRASGNVSSITDNGVGEYTANFTTSLADANYSVAGINTGNTFVANQGTTTSSVDIRSRTVTSAPAAFDSANISVAVFR